MDELIKKHEYYKSLGISMWVDEIYERIKLKEDMELKAWEMESLYSENKIRLEKDKAVRGAELKSWAEKVTEKTVDGILKQEFMEKDLEQNALQTGYKLLLKVAKNIELYTNIVKLNIKTTTNI